MNHNLVTEFEQCLQSLTDVGFEAHRRDDLDATSYRAELRQVFEQIKDLTVTMMQSGFAGSLEQMEKLKNTLNVVGGYTRTMEACEIYWDEVSNFFPPTKECMVWNKQDLSADLKIKLAVLTIDQMPNPELFPSNVLKRIPDDRFMDALSTLVRRLVPPYRRFDVDIYEAIGELNARLEDEALHDEAAEHIMAHQDLYFPIFQKLISLVDGVIAPDAPAQSDQQIETYVRDTLKLLDFNHEQVDELYESGSYHSHMPRNSTFKAIQKQLSFPASFLCKLYDVAPHPMIKQLGEFAFKDPRGPMPYQHLERIGVVRSPEWHTSEQECRTQLSCVLLLEHAIHTPGIDISPKQLLEDADNFRSADFLYAIRALEKADIHDPECRRKALVLFDAIIENATKIRHNSWVIDRIKDSTINPKLFANQKWLRGALLENQMGL
jgi:hypothetical protein